MTAKVTNLAAWAAERASSRLDEPAPAIPTLTVQSNGLIDYVHPDLVDRDGKQVVLTYTPDGAEQMARAFAEAAERARRKP